MAMFQTPPKRLEGTKRMPAVRDAVVCAVDPTLMSGLVEVLSVLSVGLLAGVLSGFLGIGGGLLFSPLLLLMGLDAHHALATSTLAIVPTTLVGSLTHWSLGPLPWREGLVMSLAAMLVALGFSRLGLGLSAGFLLAAQATLYVFLTLTLRPRSALHKRQSSHGISLAGLTGVGGVAGLSSGLLGVGGGLVIMPLLVQRQAVPIHQAVRLSTLAVLTSSSAASVTFLADGRAALGMALALGFTASLGARWSASRLNQVSEERLLMLLRGVTFLVACDSGRRALQLWLA
jgi:uncharacterized protein